MNYFMEEKFFFPFTTIDTVLQLQLINTSVIFHGAWLNALYNMLKRLKMHKIYKQVKRFTIKIYKQVKGIKNEITL